MPDLTVFIVLEIVPHIVPIKSFGREKKEGRDRGRRDRETDRGELLDDIKEEPCWQICSEHREQLIQRGKIQHTWGSTEDFPYIPMASRCSLMCLYRHLLMAGVFVAGKTDGGRLKNGLLQISPLANPQNLWLLPYTPKKEYYLIWQKYVS